ncbi:MAG TPA: hypothetical protein VFQ38_06555 [Longimicrobiales bacterium]|nr:hypothetical protein [Longimicrobiales bacterium]
MAEVIVRFQGAQTAPDGRAYLAQACGRAREDGSWEGWIEFHPVDGRTPVRTGRETTQPGRDELAYWATGLGNAYLDGALERALRPPLAPREPVAPAVPAFPGPAPRPGGAGIPPGGAVLDPFAVYAEGEDVLRSQLNAMAAGHLRNIVRGYALSAATAAELERMDHITLVATIVAGVRAGVR